MGNENTIISRCGDSGGVGDVSVAAGGEAVFLDPGPRLRPALPGGRLRSRYLAYLGRKLAATPYDLESHVRRVLLRLEEGDATSVFLALTDLFKVLGARGESLRANLLRRAGGALSGEQQAFLLRLAVTASASSATGGSEDTIIIRMQGTVAANEPTPLAEAQAFLEHGQFDEACSTLLDAFLANPDDALLSKELLALYLRARNLPAVGGVLEQLGERPFALRDEWLRAEFGIHAS